MNIVIMTVEEVTEIAREVRKRQAFQASLSAGWTRKVHNTKARKMRDQVAKSDFRRKDW